MKVLVDTNVVVRAAQPNSPDWPTIEQALSKLIGLGEISVLFLRISMSFGLSLRDLRTSTASG